MANADASGRLCARRSFNLLVYVVSPASPSLLDRIACGVLVVGAALCVLVAVPHLTFELDRFYVPKEFVLHATAFLCGALLLPRLRQLSFNRVDLLLSLFLAASLLSALLAQNGWNAARFLAMTGSGLLLYASGRALGSAGLVRPLLYGLAVVVVLAAATALAQAYGLESQWFSRNRAPGGTLGNRNSIGHLMAFGAPLLLLAALDARSLRRFALPATGLALCMIALVLTRSRAAWLAFGCVLLVYVVGTILITYRHRTARLPLRLLLLAVLMGSGAGLALLLPNALNWRSDTPYLETARSLTNHREGSGKGRLVQYRQSLKMLLHDPILGVGPGNWPVAYPAYAARRDPSMSTRQAGMTMNPWPSSDAVALVSERGLLSLVPLVLALLLLGLTTVRGLFRATTPEGALGALTLLAVWAGVAVSGLFDAVLLLPWPMLIVAAVTGALWASTTARPVAVRRSVQMGLLALLVLASAAASVRSYRQIAAMQAFESSSPARWQRAASLDPGNFRIRLRLAQRGDPGERCAHAESAHRLYPHARAAERLAQRCQ